MNRTILILLAALLALPMSAESRYSVYKAKGTVLVFPKAEKTWKEASPKRELQLRDSLRLGEQSAVIILDNANSLLYTYEKRGECTVMEALRYARDKAGARTAAVNAEMKRCIESRTDASSYEVLGVTYRGHGTVSYTDSLAARLRLLPQLSKEGAKLSLALEPSRGAKVFRIRNGSVVPLFVNVLRVSGEDLTVCLEFDGKVPFSAPGLSVSEFRENMGTALRLR